MTSFTSKSTVTLNNGIKMPIIGLGTFQGGSNKSTEEAVYHALQAGYRLIDTAAMYGNEKYVGSGIKQAEVSREEIFITTKVWFTDLRYDAVIKSCNKSLKLLDTDYVDLLLIHWPVGDYLLEAWKAFETLLKEGKCRSIGVSNFKISHLNNFLENSSTVPVVNQVEFHVFLYQEELLNFCKGHQIQLEAYSPLTRANKLDDPLVIAMATKYQKTVAQIMIRWCVEHGVIVIPKSSNKDRIEENVNIFDFSISKEDMNALDALNQNLRIGWYPSGY